MNKPRYKYGLRIVDAETFDSNPTRYELKVNLPNPPLCPYGNPQKYVGFDTKTDEYIRFTKSVFKRLFNKYKIKNEDNKNE